MLKLVLGRNTWNHMTVWELFVLDRNTWYRITVQPDDYKQKSTIWKNKTGVDMLLNKTN